MMMKKSRKQKAMKSQKKTQKKMAKKTTKELNGSVMSEFSALGIPIAAAVTWLCIASDSVDWKLLGAGVCMYFLAWICAVVMAAGKQPQRER